MAQKEEEIKGKSQFFPSDNPKIVLAISRNIEKSLRRNEGKPSFQQEDLEE